MSIFSSIRDVDLEDEVAALRKEVAALTRSLSKRGASAYRGTRDEAADLYGDIADRIIAALPGMRRQAQSLERTVRDHPTQTVAVVGLATLAVAAAVLFARR